MPKTKLSVSERLDAKSEPQMNGCVHFTGALNGGYGRIMHQGRNCLAHKLTYELRWGLVPEGLCVLHRCDNPKCVNVDHLFLGTRADNNADKVAKNRQSRLTGSPGERRPLAKLRNEDIPKIRADPRPQSKIAAEYGISQAVISRIKTGRNWRHVQEP